MLSFRQYTCLQNILRPEWLNKNHSILWPDGCYFVYLPKAPQSSIRRSLKRHSHLWWFWKCFIFWLLNGFFFMIQFTTFRNLSGGVSLPLQFSQTPREEEFLMPLILTPHLLSNTLQVSAPLTFISSPLPLTFLVLFISYSFTWLCLTEPGTWTGKEFVTQGRGRGREDKNVSLFQDEIWKHWSLFSLIVKLRGSTAH